MKTQQSSVRPAESDCNFLTGQGCTNPQPGARFYPVFSPRVMGSNPTGSGCFWQLGGTSLPGTRPLFGGSSSVEYGELYQGTFYQVRDASVLEYEDFHRNT